TFLASKGYIHRDLAARNVLITSQMAAKIADFGLCRRLHEEIYTMQRRMKLPLKWTAPEALSSLLDPGFSWSFGVLLYEIFSGGKEPFENVLPSDLFRHLDEGYRMEQPDFCSADV
ncbi:TK/CSK protein kinase, partial [Aphelenchoides avenae]